MIIPDKRICLYQFSYRDKSSFEENLLLTKPAIGVDSLLIFLMTPGFSLLIKLVVNKQHMQLQESQHQLHVLFNIFKKHTYDSSISNIFFRPKSPRKNKQPRKYTKKQKPALSTIVNRSLKAYKHIFYIEGHVLKNSSTFVKER